VPDGATYCEMCGARVAPVPTSAARVWHGMSGTAVIVLAAATATGLAIVVGLIVLVRSLAS